MSPILLNSYAGAAGGVSWPSPPALPVTAQLWAHYARGVGIYSDLGTTLQTTDGGTARQWNDSSGNGRHATGGSTTSPTLDLTHTYLSIPTIFAPGSPSQWLNIPDMSALSELEVYITVKAGADPATGTFIGFWDMGSSASSSHYPYLDGNIYDSCGSTTRQTVGNPSPDLSSAFRQYNVFSRNSASGDPDGDTALWRAILDTSSIFSTTTNTVGCQSSPKIFRNRGNDDMHGAIAELIIYTSKRTATQRADINTYLTNN